MARENYVHLHGMVRTSPKVYIDGNGKAIKGVVALNVIRRPTKGAGYASKLFFDCPILITKNEEMIEEFRNLHIYDMVDIKGVISTKNMKKSSTCPFCGKKNYVEGTLTYVTPLSVIKVNAVKDENEGFSLLKQRWEVSNELIIIGYLCRDPEYYEDEKHISYAHYPLAVNRRYHIREDADDRKTDYPWVKTYGKQALDDSQRLKKGSMISINGAVQMREIERATICSECGENYTWNETVSEIVPYYIGYLDDSYKEGFADEEDEYSEET